MRAPRSPRIAAALAFLSGFALVAFAGCHDRREVEGPPAPCAPGACPPGQWPTLPSPTADTSPTAAPPGLARAFVGFPCATTEDLICGWGKCLVGRCGGCQTAADCKSGGACAATPLGMMCVYGGPNAPR